MTNLDQFCEALAKLGISASTCLEGEATSGFPVILRLGDGSPLYLDLPEAILLNNLDPDAVGMAVIDSAGTVRKTWGMVRDLAETSILDSELASTVMNAFRGVQGALYLNGRRYFVGPLKNPNGNEVLLLAVDASDEEVHLRQAQRFEFEARGLRKIGKVLTMNQTLETICYSAVHEIASVAELSVALLWVEGENGAYDLRSSVGANRNGTTLLAQLHDSGTYTCAAELVIGKREPFLVRQVSGHILTADLEAKFCYLKPGGLLVLPLMIGDRLLGVLELIARDQDFEFFERRGFFETVAEHLALALNSALMFESFERLATIDPLTGVANHRAMQEFLLRRIFEQERSGQEMGVIMLDVDHFRSFNEEEGHDAGDQVLRKVVDAMRQAIRPYDLAARYGGEEFTVILPNSSAEEAMRVAERIRKKIEQIEYITASGLRRVVTASLGVAMYPHISREPQALLKAADVALYQAKGAGRNRCVLYVPELGAGKDPATEIDLTAVLKGKWRKSGEAFAEAQGGLLQSLSIDLALSAGQQQILKAVLKLLPLYSDAMASGNERTLRLLKEAGELRTVWPTLEGTRESYDGSAATGKSGDQVPLLSRLATILFEAHAHAGQGFVSEPGRFDPHLVNLVLRSQRAA
ncbi:MAG: sensor domain-containing diguanylate cyclase [Chthonomonas sp.]|nr:sensor domain-containing diguanylate cyclase [Chthonomonas sp.]